MTKILVGYAYFHKVAINDANAISGPLTYGIPAVTGFAGAFHALSRKLMTQENFGQLALDGVLIACYDYHLKVYRENRYRDYTFTQTRNPLRKDGAPAAIVEEGKCNLLMSFLVQVYADAPLGTPQKEALSDYLSQTLYHQRIAGGSVMDIDSVRFIDIDKIQSIIALLTPAFVLMDANEDFRVLIEQAQDSTPLDVLLDVCTLHHLPTEQAGGTTWQTRSIKTGHGWLVPMPMGYQPISERFAAGVMQHARRSDYPSQYVEVIYGLGKWIYPHDLRADGGKYSLEQAFWRQIYQDDLYLVTQAPREDNDLDDDDYF